VEKHDDRGVKRMSDKDKLKKIIKLLEDAEYSGSGRFANFYNKVKEILQ
jgi:hypothetical protein